MLKKFSVIFLVIFLSGTCMLAQDDLEDMLSGEVENWNPIYKPVIGAGIGTFNFLGDVKNPNLAPFNGTLGYKVNVSTFLDNAHNIRANFFFMGGSLTGNERSSEDLTRNMNFKSDILLFGINLNYDFDHFYKTYRKVHPFISIGVESLTFNSMTDSLGFEDVRYNYGNDGGIYNLPENDPSATLIRRDFTYETQLRQYDWGMGRYPQYAFAVPVDAGLDFWLADRVMFRVGASYHFVFTDLIDHVSPENTTGRIGEAGNDNFLFTYVSMHLDLFSSDKTLTWEKLYQEMEWDGTMMDDEDGDGYFDGWDECPNTPFGVEVDTAGCPLDDDFDGYPNYMDDEPHSRYGAFVDERGVEISEDDLIARLDMSKAVAREDVPLYIRTPESYGNYRSSALGEIPEKFIEVDKNNDKYISFEELMNTIDKFFDFDSDYTTDDIYELNDIFFSQ
ncbi:MAG: hypothetical protein JXA77_18065 [Bacteroidales bacterium]|nr:hypothetical protein [Bacteroidales bacterium]MBN2818090.1 hypothetical protein [Bacteroidales bacterium]